ncbi:PAAR domain-containing protein [Microcoleus sp. D2_18a_D3]|uniref:PAAR domain-containing protein n=1 Tax=Microcoleus sp. D2_18a_D3 TaxID=3055330 RepID=UPI002FD04524
MGRAAARIIDPVAHPLPPVLTGGPGSSNVWIGNLPAWRGLPTAAVPDLIAAVKDSGLAIKKAELATELAKGKPPAEGLAKANEIKTKADEAIKMGKKIANIAAGGTDIHTCTTPLPLPPHGPGVVIDGSATVLINGLPACRAGDTIVEAIGPPNKIIAGCFTVQIGG